MHVTTAELMKAAEKAHREIIDPWNYLLIRLDGKAFHTYTRKLESPIDTRLMEAMDETTKFLCENIQGVVAAYVQSDEISLVIAPWKHLEPDEANPSGIRVSELWMGGVVPKILSLSAAMASAKFNDIRLIQADIEADNTEDFDFKRFHPSLALFDSRLWTFPATREGFDLTLRYFDWRHRDAFKNAVTSVAQAEFGHSKLHKKNTDDKIAMLEDIGIKFEEVNEWFVHGRLFTKMEFMQTVTYTHQVTGEQEQAQALRRAWVMSPYTMLNLKEALTDPIAEGENDRLGD